MTVDLFLAIAAAICFGLAALNVNSPVNLIALGLMFWVLTVIV